MRWPAVFVLLTACRFMGTSSGTAPRHTNAIVVAIEPREPGATALLRAMFAFDRRVTVIAAEAPGALDDQCAWAPWRRLHRLGDDDHGVSSRVCLRRVPLAELLEVAVLA